MAKARRKPGAGARGRFKRKNMGKGYATIHQPHYLVRLPRVKAVTAEEAGTGGTPAKS